MKKVLITGRFVQAAIALTLFFSTYSSAWAGTDEDLLFAEALFRRRWHDWALEVTTDLVETSRNPYLLRGDAAELRVAIMRQWGKETGDQEKLDRAEALNARYKKEFMNHPKFGGWGPKLAELDIQRQKAEDLAKKADPEVEPNPEKRKEYTAAAVKIFEEIDSKYKELISKLRLEVAKYPPKMEWFRWSRRASAASFPVSSARNGRFTTRAGTAFGTAFIVARRIKGSASSSPTCRLQGIRSSGG